MSNRERMTWGGKSAAGPTLPIEAAAAKKGSAHPQTPDEGITHPAGYQDPTQPAAYENGDTSSWAEDPKPGPYRTSPQPANPMDDGGYRHPAAQPGAPAKNAADKEAKQALRAAVELKAAKAIRIASVLLGEKITKAADAGDLVASEMLEAQSIAFMDLHDEHLASTLRRIEAATEDEEVLLRKMLAEDAGEPEEKEEEEEKKEASSDKLAEITTMLASLQAQMAALSAPKVAEAPKAAEAPKVAEEETMLAAMMAEESKKAEAPNEDAEAEAMLKAMLAEEQAPAAEPVKEEAPATAGKTLADLIDMDDDFGINMDVVEDPMGLVDAPDFGEDEMLASLFASDSSKTAEEEKEQEEEGDEGAEKDEEEEKEEKQAAVKVASVDSRLRPQAKKANVGAKTVGTVRVAGNTGDVSELAKLWDSAPDVSKIFNS